MQKTFWGLIIVWALFRSYLLFLGYTGYQAPEFRQRVLQYFTETDIRVGEEYLRLGFWVRVISPFVRIVILLLLIYTGTVSRWYEAISQRFPGFWISGILFLVSFFFVLFLVFLPVSLYQGFFREHWAGFSNMTIGAWFWRMFKGIIIGWPIQIGTTLLILWLIKFLPRGWPIVIPVCTTLLGMIFSVIFPIIVTPLFYEQKPLSDGPLKTRILEISEKCKIPVEGIYEIDESRYSKHTNAYFSGLFSKKRIVLFDTLIESHTVDEAALIFAHEAGHWQHDHIFKGIVLGFLGTLAGCLAAFWGWPYVQSTPSFHLKDLWSPVNVPFFTVLFMVFGLFFAPIEAQISQYMEKQADWASLELTGLSQTFIDAEVRLARDNKAHLLPHPVRVFCLYSHPPAIDRIAMGLRYKKEKGDSSP